jgi:hypothetical protein
MSHGLPSSFPADSSAVKVASITILISHSGNPQRKKATRTFIRQPKHEKFELARFD